MDRLELASVPAELPLPEALKKFRPNTRALVVRHGGKGYLLTASDIANGMNSAVDIDYDPALVTVGDIATQMLARQVPAPALPAAHTRSASRSFSSQESAAFTKAFDPVIIGASPQLYTIQHLGDATAIVVTSSERLRAELGETTTICRCVGPKVHTFEKRQLVDPDKCNKPHRVAVVCTRAS
jgi:hypothetical protein